ncbi:hypothetical protein [Crucivirus-539]|nr:hypothetical protein [Crucivirus-539]
MPAALTLTSGPLRFTLIEREGVFTLAPLRRIGSPPNLPTSQPPNLPTSQPPNLPTSQPPNLPTAPLRRRSAANKLSSASYGPAFRRARLSSFIFMIGWWLEIPHPLCVAWGVVRSSSNDKFLIKWLLSLK